ncbi:MAG TPA: hypothetical protein VFX11_03790, partial [Candidatus Kapabacteria bacterium]|nr:hypothetical protein [Candidatus Kapabacteria bacterium]
VGSCLLVVSLAMGTQAHALESLDDGALAEVNGTGVALAFDNFSSRFAPTSYINMLGTNVVDNTGIVFDATLNGGEGGCRNSASGSPALPASSCDPYDAPSNWRRGDLYYYGLSMSGGNVNYGMDWYGTGTAGGGCTPGADGLGCPIGRINGSSQVEGIKNWASVYNPYMIRVFQYAGYSYEGTCLGSEVSGKCSQVSLATSPTYYEFVGPSKGDKWRWAFWGELLVNNGALALGGAGDTFSGTCNGASVTAGANCAGILKSQTIILGNNFTLDNKPTRLQIVQTPTTTVSEQSLSVVYQSRLSGNFRFSVAQTGTYAQSVAHGIVPDFNDVEGMVFKNVDAFLPLGQNNYQSVVFRNNGTSGNFTVELTPISSNTNVSNTFYCGQNNCASFVTSGIPEATGGVGLNGSNAAIGCVNQLGNVVACTGIYDRSVKVKTGENCTTAWTSICDTAESIINPANSNPDSHGYVYWGTPTETRSGVAGVTAPAACTAPCNTNTDNGIYFRAPNGDVVNIGRAKVTGMMIQMMKITSLGVGP